jgi:hypothetical protein
LLYRNNEIGWNQLDLAVLSGGQGYFQGNGAKNMRNPTDRAYYERRAKEERQRARAARNHCAANMHRDLAVEYERRAEALSRSELVLTVAAE